MVSSLDGKHKGPTRESGKRLYMVDEDYPDAIRKVPIKAFDTGEQAWSEFEKPYWEDSYEEMEYLMWNFPSFPPWQWDVSWDNPSIPGVQDAGLGGLLVFNCTVDGGFCPGETRCVVLDCSHPVIGVGLSNSWAAREFSLSAASPVSLCITAVEDSAGGVEIDIFMQSAGGVRGSHENILVAQATDCEACTDPDRTVITFDGATGNPTVVLDSNNYQISFVGGIGPYAWSVAGQNVSMQWTETTNRWNYLQVGDSCGAIEVTVVDSCGDTATLWIRSIDGTWNLCYGIGRGGTACDCVFTGGGSPFVLWVNETHYLDEVHRAREIAAYCINIGGCCLLPGFSETHVCWPGLAQPGFT